VRNKRATKKAKLRHAQLRRMWVSSEITQHGLTHEGLKIFQSATSFREVARFVAQVARVIAPENAADNCIFSNSVPINHTQQN